MSFASYKREFQSNPSVNPETGRSITIGGDKYNALFKKYGKGAKRSPVRKSPPRGRQVKMAPSPKSQRSPRSPRLEKDPFEVLSDQSIMNVLTKLTEENRIAWARASPKVRAIYQRMNI